MKLVAHENVDSPIHNAGYIQVRQHLLSKGVTLAEPENKSDELKNVHILVGADYVSYFIIGIEKVDRISLFLTHNGMSPYGKVQQWLLEGKKIEHVKTLRVFRIASEPNQFDVNEWWRLDRVAIAPSEQYSVREVEAMRKVLQSVVKKPEGYQVCRFSLSHVPSKQNPADVLSRGAMTQRQLQNPLWQNGTEFLRTMGEPVPYKEDDPTNEITVVAAVQEMREEIRPVLPGEIWEILQRKLEFRFLLRVARIILKFAKLKRHPFSIVVQLEQKHYLPTVYAYFEGGVRPPREVTNFIRQLNLVLNNKLICTRGRVSQVEEMKHLILLPAKGHLVRAYLRYLHSLHLHCGVNTLMGIFQKKCWWLGLRSIARRIVRHCPECVLAFQPLLRQPPPPLPKERINLTKRFTAVGVDHTAAILTETRPGYILIVTCMASRAVYLDFCPSLESEEFVLALRRFCATHSAPSFITSDNHQTFKTARNLLQGLYEEDEIALGKKYLPDVHVLALVKEAEAMVNNRPLMYSGDKCEDKVLTPSHLWWRKEYLRALRARQDCQSGEPSKLHPGDVVLVKQENQKRAMWPLGHIVETYPNSDGVVCSAKVLFEGVESLHLFSHLVPREVAPSDDDDVVGEDDGDVEIEGANSLTAGLPGIVEMSGDNQEMVQATTFRQQATEVLRSDANSDNNTASEMSESDVESEATGAQGPSARPLRKAAAKQRDLMERLRQNEHI
ncbi:uncharacterized protein [Palaemon carinicauda]|uniref:uncharacterized protein n=1 Tax=Palaemon carinicauda TaxID=392227 RepID=UPI0035B5E87A